ncbi:hypothetical protein EDC01DRAFT_690174 [Geopyxis carbonaria]|nr:hypothetical protein EDC01DRAFT_690174 [Geopyxis carbonaria]
MLTATCVHLALWVFGAAASAAGPASQIPIVGDANININPTGLRRDEDPEEPPRKLHGRFLHITDLHPDPFYKDGASVDQKCHRQKGDAGYWGAETSSCDTPWSLVNETFRWIDENLKDKIDFVIWTGDSARHDNDVKIPRTSHQIYDLNQKAVHKMLEVFGKADNIDDNNPTNDLLVPIVPNLGNNDIFPHNIMLPGPSKLTHEYVEIWKHFIPEDQYHVFHKGAYFWQQVIPGHNGKIGPSSMGGLAVFSLNTIFFYESNKAVDGCDNKDEPGYQQMEWLDIQLGLMRDRGMKAILIGHVPPAWTETKRNWDPTCWRKYVLWARQYRDVIVGHLYGHMNLDHFFLLDSDELEPGHKTKKGKANKGKTKKGKSKSIEEPVFAKDDVCFIEEYDPETDPVVSISSAEEYLHSLRKSFASLPHPKTDGASSKKDNYKKLIGGKWAERYILTLVGPSVIPNYFPTLRVIEYNTTGLVDNHGKLVVTREDNAETEKNNNNKKKKKKPKKPAAPVKEPHGPSKSSPPGPAYSMQPYSWIGYTQYFANLTEFNARFLEEQQDARDIDVELKKRDVSPAKKKKKASIEYEVEYDTRTDKTYKLKDMTVRSYLKLAQRIVDSSKKKTASLDHSDDDNDALVEDEDTSDLAGEESTGDFNLEKKKKKKHKKPKNGKKPHKNRVWHTFTKRAFVCAVPDEKITQLQEKREGCSARLTLEEED